jgi:DNA-binding MarR family transcriptional regulator
MDASDGERLSTEQYAALANFRFVGRTPATVGLLAEHLLIAPHSAAELVARMVEGGLLTKTRAVEDRRRSELALTPRAEALLRTLTAAHLEELRGLAPALAEALAPR